MSEVDFKDFVCENSREKYEIGVSSSSELQSEQRDRDTIPNLKSILFKYKMLFNSFYWNTRTLLSTVTTRGRI